MIMAKTKIPGVYKDRGALGQFVPVDEGEYLVQLDSVEETESKNGNYQLVAELIVVDGPEQEDGRDPKGQKIFDRCTVTDHPFTVTRLKNFLNAFQIPVSTQDSFDPKDGLGKKASAVIEIEEYTTKDGESRESNKVHHYVLED
jgi:hypothetical protein